MAIYDKDFKSKDKDKIKDIRLKNLVQYSDRPRSLESKQKSLQNLSAAKSEITKELAERIGQLPYTIPEHIRESLTETELVFFINEKEKLLRDYQDVNGSSDESDIDDMLTERVYRIRLFKMQKLKPALDISDLLDKSHHRYMDFRKNLAARRIDRISTGESKQRPSIATLSAKFAGEAGLEMMKKRVAEGEKEIDEFIKRVSERKSNDNGDPN